MHERFFESRQGAALVKHSVLDPYIRLFVNKLGSRYETVQYLDGYAGPGVYNDGTPGSPLLAVEVRDLVDQIRDLKATFVERDSIHAKALATLLAEHSIDATVINDDLANALPDILDGCRKDPLLAFLDPFGLTESHVLGMSGSTVVEPDVVDDDASHIVLGSVVEGEVDAAAFGRGYGVVDFQVRPAVVGGPAVRE